MNQNKLKYFTRNDLRTSNNENCFKETETHKVIIGVLLFLKKLT